MVKIRKHIRITEQLNKGGQKGMKKERERLREVEREREKERKRGREGKNQN